MPLALGVEHEVVPAERLGEFPPVLRAEVRGVRREGVDLRVVDLVVEAANPLGALVGDGDPPVAEERHLPEAVVTVTALDLDGQGADLAPETESRGEEVAQWNFHRGHLGSVPIDAQHECARITDVHRGGH